MRGHVSCPCGAGACSSPHRSARSADEGEGAATDEDIPQEGGGAGGSRALDDGDAGPPETEDGECARGRRARGSTVTQGGCWMVRRRTSRLARSVSQTFHKRLTNVTPHVLRALSHKDTHSLSLSVSRSLASAPSSHSLASLSLSTLPSLSFLPFLIRSISLVPLLPLFHTLLCFTQVYFL